MIKIIEDISVSERRKNLEASIEKVIKRLKTVKENVQFNPDKYDLETLLNILCQMYDDIGDFNIVVDEETV